LGTRIRTNVEIYAPKAQGGGRRRIRLQKATCENERIGNAKLFDLLEGTHLVVREDKGIAIISPVLADLVR